MLIETITIRFAVKFSLKMAIQLFSEFKFQNFDFYDNPLFDSLFKGSKCGLINISSTFKTQDRYDRSILFRLGTN